MLQKQKPLDFSSSSSSLAICQISGWLPLSRIIKSKKRSSGEPKAVRFFKLNFIPFLLFSPACICQTACCKSGDARWRRWGGCRKWVWEITWLAFGMGEGGGDGMSIFQSKRLTIFGLGGISTYFPLINDPWLLLQKKRRRSENSTVFSARFLT